MSNSMLLHELNWVTPEEGYVGLPRAELPGGYMILKNGNGTYNIVPRNLNCDPQWFDLDPATAQSVLFFLEANPQVGGANPADNNI